MGDKKTTRPRFAKPARSLLIGQQFPIDTNSMIHVFTADKYLLDGLRGDTPPDNEIRKQIRMFKPVKCIYCDSHVLHGVIPHLHYEVSDWYENEPTPPTPLPKAIRNPLNGIVPFTDTSQPETIEIHFRVDDFTPTPVYKMDEMFEIKEEERSGIFEFISGKMDVITRVSDDNDVNDIGHPEQSCGIHQIQYKIYDGFDLSGIILQEGILFNDTTFRGEHPSFDDEYTPYFFDIYTGCHTVPWSDVLDEYNTRNFEYHYIVTNNTDPDQARKLKAVFEKIQTS